MAAAAAVLLEEELQQSLATHDEDAAFEEDYDAAAEIIEENEDAYAANHQLHDGMRDDHSEMEDLEDEIVEEMLSEEEGDDDEEEGDDDDDDDDDEEEDEMADSIPDFDGDEEADEDVESEEADEEEDEEGVGAVKIQPGRLQDDDEDVLTGSDSDSDGSAASAEDDDESKNSSDVDIEARWEPAADEEDEEPANPNRCIFCQLDEESDPSEVFELYLACDVCGDNAHRQCARSSKALKTDEEAEHWICPECVNNNLKPELIVANSPESHEPGSPKLSRDRVPGDLLPSHRGTIKPDSHSVFNQLITPDDPMDGSRLLRKRKTSSIEAEADATPPVRRRAREQAVGSAGSKDAQLPVMSETTEMDYLEPPITNGQEKKDELQTTTRVSRSLRPKSSPKEARASILEKTATSLKIRFTSSPDALREILSKAPKPQKRKRPTSSRPAAGTSTALTSTSNYAPSSYSQPFYSLHEKDIDELKSKPYGGILTEAESDTAMTLPKPEHRRQFDEARQKAEEEWKIRVAKAAEAAAALGIKKPKKVSGPASQIEYIEFGQYQIDIWYAAPYPEEYSRNKALFICEFCLKYMESDIVAWRHKTKCHHKHPPGDEIYRDGKIMIFEVDGRKNPLYCQNLCLLAKLFLGSKTLYYDVEPFLFYVMTEYDEFGCHFVGYFSKEKRPSSLNNVSCILVLPIHQRKGYGHLLIDFSYLLTRVEKKTGSPEKPLSDMGLVSYRNYWRLVLCYYLRDYKPGDRVPSVRKMSDEMGLTPDDVISALDALGALLRDPVTGTYAFKLKTDYYREVVKQHEAKGYAKLNPKGLTWTPYIMGRGNASAFDHAPPLNGLGHRDDDEEETTTLVTNGKRDFESFNDDSVDGSNGITESIGKLTTKPNGDLATPRVNGVSKKLAYYEAAASIPATRFEVFPPAPGARKSASRPSVSRPSPSSRSRSSLGTSTPIRPPRPRPTTTSSRRSSASRPSRSGGSRRKTGGTGRGPGRWPKGTTKADFDNADSGPGLPPALIKQRSKLGNEVLLGDEAEEVNSADGENVVLDEGNDILFDSKPRTRRDRQSGRGLGLGKPGLGKPSLDGKGRPIIPEGLGKGAVLVGGGGNDVKMELGVLAEDLMDIDAEGEDE